MGAFIVGERVVRDGRLVAYAGQVMTEAEAARLGLLGASEGAQQAPAGPSEGSQKAEKPSKGAAKAPKGGK